MTRIARPPPSRTHSRNDGNCWEAGGPENLADCWRVSARYDSFGQAAKKEGSKSSSSQRGYWAFGGGMQVHGG